MLEFTTQVQISQRAVRPVQDLHSVESVIYYVCYNCW